MENTKKHNMWIIIEVDKSCRQNVLDGVMRQKFSMVLYVLDACCILDASDASYAFLTKVLTFEQIIVDNLTKISWMLQIMLNMRDKNKCWQSFENSKNTCVLIIDYDRLSKLCYH